LQKHSKWNSYKNQLWDSIIYYMITSIVSHKTQQLYKEFSNATLFQTCSSRRRWSCQGKGRCSSSKHYELLGQRGPVMHPAAPPGIKWTISLQYKKKRKDMWITILPCNPSKQERARAASEILVEVVPCTLLPSHRASPMIHPRTGNRHVSRNVLAVKHLKLPKRIH